MMHLSPASSTAELNLPLIFESLRAEGEEDSEWSLQPDQAEMNRMAASNSEGIAAAMNSNSASNSEGIAASSNLVVCNGVSFKTKGTFEYFGIELREMRVRDKNCRMQFERSGKVTSSPNGTTIRKLCRFCNQIQKTISCINASHEYDFVGDLLRTSKKSVKGSSPDKESKDSEDCKKSKTGKGRIVSFVVIDQKGTDSKLGCVKFRAFVSFDRRDNLKPDLQCLAERLN